MQIIINKISSTEVDTRFIWKNSIYSVLIKTIREDYNRRGYINIQEHHLQFMGGTNLLVSSAPTGRRFQPPSFYQLQLIGCCNTLIFQVQLEGGYNPLEHRIQPMILVPPSRPQKE